MYTLEESIGGNKLLRFHTLKYLVAKIIAYVKIWTLVNFEIIKFSSS